MSSQALRGWFAAHSSAWLLVSVALLLVVGGAEVSQRGPRGAQTRVLGQQFTAAGSTTGSNNGCGNGNGGTSGQKDCSNPAKAFSLSGAVNGPLAPGLSRQLLVTVSNPNNQPMQVTKISVTVGNPTGGLGRPSLPACVKGWVSSVNYLYVSGTKTIAPANGAVVVSLPISLVNLSATNQDNCKGATFPISLTGEGQQA